MSALETFLTELAALTQKHGLEIGGCGDCGSPWIEPVSQNVNQADIVLEHLTYCQDHKRYHGEGCRGCPECNAPEPTPFD